MVNKMLKAFLNNSNNREYLQLLFKPIFYEATDLMTYANRITTDKKECGEDNSSFDIAKKSSGTPTSVIEELKPKDYTENSKTKYETSIAKTPKNLKTTPKNITLICQGILKRIIKKLNYMPLCTRYLCKILEEISKKHVIQF